MTMPDRIQITYQPKTMATPDFRALCAELLQALLLGDDIAGPMNRARPATLPTPEPGEAKELHPLWYLIEFLEGHSSFLRRTDPTDELAQVLSDSATLLKRLASPAYLVVGRPPEGCLEPLKSKLGQVEACTAGVSIELLGDAPRPTYLDAIRLAEGCHDYSGGHSGPEGEAWHGAIDTVVDVLKRAAIKPWDSQTMAVFGVGVESGRVAVPGPVSECPYCGYEGEMVPAPQAGDVALAGDRRSAESLQLAHESCRLFGTKNGDCPDSEICWLDLLPCSHYENCATIPASQDEEVEA